MNHVPHDFLQQILFQNCGFGPLGSGRPFVVLLLTPPCHWTALCKRGHWGVCHEVVNQSAPLVCGGGLSAGLFATNMQPFVASLTSFCTCASVGQVVVEANRFSRAGDIGVAQKLLRHRCPGCLGFALAALATHPFPAPLPFGEGFGRPPGCGFGSPSADLLVWLHIGLG